MLPYFSSSYQSHEVARSFVIMFADLPPDLKEDANGLFPLDEGLMHFKLID